MEVIAVLEWSEIRLYDVTQLPPETVNALTSDPDYHHPTSYFELCHAGLPEDVVDPIRYEVRDADGRFPIEVEQYKVWKAALVDKYTIGDVLPSKYYIKQIFCVNDY